MTKAKITELPLASSLPQFLRPDPAVSTVASALHLAEYRDGDLNAPIPSNMRRSRQMRGGAHFSFVTPLPLAFPYRVPDDSIPDPPLRKVTGETVGGAPDSVAKAEDKEAEERTQAKPTTPKVVNVETLLASLEPSLQHPVASTSKLYTSPARRKALGSARLLALSESCAHDVLPEMDITSHEGREQMVQMLSGQAVFADENANFAPWSLCYGGHQFGQWAGQLGDGRAISIMTTPSPEWAHQGYPCPPVAELQLKGAGRTPFSRFADGLAVLRSSVREFLASEAMAALGIPTSRALSLVHLPDIQVMREVIETGAVVCRIAPSWLRIGSFEIQRDRAEWDSLLALAQYVSTQLFGLSKISPLEIVKQVSQRNARTFAAWQAYGFMHGVLNTDNISLLGLTIDYGPYAFQDIFESDKICNHSDDFGRYSYSNQPSMGVFAIGKLGDALAELIGLEIEEGVGRLTAGWAIDAKDTQLKSWREKGIDAVADIKRDFTRQLTAEYKRLMRMRLGMSEERNDDFKVIFEPLLEMMEQQKLDYSITLRTLCMFDGRNAEETLDKLKRGATARKEWSHWLGKYAERLTMSTEQREAVNPRFVLRQWVLEEAIQRCEKEPDFLKQVLEMSVSPFQGYKDGELARLCEVGPESMQGFMCSCSS